jgi:uncharacterized LabA/DUF88 family protein
MKRVIVYIDGFNLYFGLKSKNWSRYLWLNLQALARNILKEEQQLVRTKYFTSRVSTPPDKMRRQATFIEALETLNDFNIYYGKYQAHSFECKRCGNLILKPNEKMTDVNIAVEMMTDAFNNAFDIAILISADSDLTAPVKSIRHLFKDKEVIIAFPPDRFSFELTKVASSFLTIGRRKLAKSVFPDEIIKPGGFVLKKPTGWN